MKALSLTQPWATLVAIGAKKIETRNWFTGHRGLIAIHASKGFPRDAREFCDGLFDPELYAEVFETLGYHEPEDLPRGAIIAVATLRTCMRTSNDVYTATWLDTLDETERAFGDYSDNRYGWFLEDVRRLEEPIPCRGALGLWTVPPEIVAEIERQVAA